MNTKKVYEITEYQQGWYQQDDYYHCLYCNKTFEEGIIYSLDDQLLTAKKAIKQHLMTHNGPLAALLSLPHDTIGVTATQQEMLQLFSQQLSDTVIAQRLGVSASTVRNHRFKLKEKEQQARLFLSVMASLAVSESVLPHKGATMLDERYQITESEQAKILATYIDENGWISQLPSKEKRKLVILARIAEAFDFDKNYSEKAVNEILQQFIADYVTVRRYLIEYGFFKRTKDGKTYWKTR